MNEKLKTILSIMAVCAACLTAVWFVITHLPAKRPLIALDFTTGAKLGWAIGVRGATTNDLQRLLDAGKSQERMVEWLRMQ